MISGWRAGFQEQAAAASSRPLTFRSTRCPAPNTPWMTSHRDPCPPSPLDPKVQGVHSTHLPRGHRCPLSPTPPWAPNLTTPQWNRRHRHHSPIWLHSHALPLRHPYLKKRLIACTWAPPPLFHPPATTITGLGPTQLTRAPPLEPFHPPRVHQRPRTEQELPQRTLPDTLTAHRSALTALLRTWHNVHTHSVIVCSDRNVAHHFTFHNNDTRLLFFLGCNTKSGCSTRQFPAANASSKQLWFSNGATPSVCLHMFLFVHIVTVQNKCCSFGGEFVVKDACSQF